jgi:hypothetical protein
MMMIPERVHNFGKPFGRVDVVVYGGGAFCLLGWDKDGRNNKPPSIDMHTTGNRDKVVIEKQGVR